LGPGDSIPNSPAITTSGFFVSAGASLTPDSSTVNSPVYGALAPFGLAPLLATKPYRIDMWSVNDSGTTPQGGSYSTASTSAGTASPYYLDNDGAQRVGDARYAYPGSSPYFTGTTAVRPVILNRPFTSVGELGYVFRDIPWKTLDLFSPGSADGGLLDLFSLSDAPLLAGRVNPNAAPPPVLTALLSGAQLNMTNSLSASAASGIAGAIYGAATNNPFRTRAELVPFLAASAVVTNQTPTGIKIEREAAIRALAESANTRTWNFLIDVIGESGFYPAKAASLDQFQVTGERRYWLHIAIDRYTGQIVDRQLEAVQE